MRTRRAIIVSAILTLGVAGSILAGSAAHVAAAPTHTAHVLAAQPDMLYYG